MCDHCHHDHQPIHDAIDSEFESFVNNNRDWINEMKDGEIRRLDPNVVKVLVDGEHYTVCSTNLLKDPFDVRYVGLRGGGEGNIIVFLDGAMNRIFSYYDVM